MCVFIQPCSLDLRVHLGTYRAVKPFPMHSVALLQLTDLALCMLLTDVPNSQAHVRLFDARDGHDATSPPAGRERLFPLYPLLRKSLGLFPIMVSMGAGRVTSPGRSASLAAQAAPLARAAENRTRTRSPSRAQNPRSRVGVPASFLQDSHALAPDSRYWAAPHGDHGGRHRTLPLRDGWR